MVGLSKLVEDLTFTKQARANGVVDTMILTFDLA